MLRNVGLQTREKGQNSKKTPTFNFITQKLVKIV